MFYSYKKNTKFIKNIVLTTSIFCFSIKLAYAGALVSGSGVGTTEGGIIATSDEVNSASEKTINKINSRINSSEEKIVNSLNQNFSSNISAINKGALDIKSELRMINTSIINSGKTVETVLNSNDDIEPLSKNIQNDAFQKQSKIINTPLRCKGSSTFKGLSSVSGQTEAVQEIVSESVSKDIKGPKAGTVGQEYVRVFKVSNDPIAIKAGTGIFNADNLNEKQVASGKDIISVLAEPNPKSQLTDKQSKTVIGSSYQMIKNLKDEENKLARDVLSKRLAESTATKDAKFLSIMIPRTSENLDAIVALNNNEKLSEKQIERAIVTYFSSSDAFKNREALSAVNNNGASERSLMSEANTINSIELRLQLKILRTLQNIEAMLAQETLDRVNKKYDKKLNKLYKSVLSSK